jgi:hypothetical protein
VHEDNVIDQADANIKARVCLVDDNDNGQAWVETMMEVPRTDTDTPPMKTTTLGHYLTWTSNGRVVTQRESDGYVHVMELCNGLKHITYLQVYTGHTELTGIEGITGSREFLDALASKLGVPVSQLLVNNWLHPHVATYLAIATDATFAAIVMDWTSRAMDGDLGLLYDLVDTYQATHVDRRFMVTVTLAASDIWHDAHNLLHEDNVVSQRKRCMKTCVAHVIMNMTTGEETLQDVERTNDCRVQSRESTQQTDAQSV